MHLNWFRRGGESGLDQPLLDLDKKEANPATPATRRRKGRLPVMVGPVWEKQQLFTVSLDQYDHDLFSVLLQEADDEYGFDHQDQRPGTISLPCSVDRFHRVLDMIEQDRRCGSRCGSAHCHRHHRRRVLSSFRV